MKRQIILIRGWEVKENYKDFYDFLEKQEFDPYEEKTKWWYKDFDKFIWNNFDPIVIPTPNNDFADYESWKIVFEKMIPYLKNDSILIGHSLWGTFLVKYFNEENNNKLLEKIRKIILVAPAFEDIEWDLIWSFNFDKKLENLKIIQDKITIFCSRDDFIVPFSHFESFINILPKAEYKIFEDRWHFLQEDFPELIEKIKQ